MSAPPFRFKLTPSPGALLTRLSLLGLLAVLAPTLAPLHWTLDLLSHLQIQAALGLTGMLTLTLALRRWHAGATIACFLALSLFRLSPLVIGPGMRDSDHAEDSTLAITAFNVLSTNPEKANTADYVRRTGSDVLIFCETTRAWTEHLLGALPDYKHHHADTREDNFGLLILSKWPLSGPATHFPSPGGFPLLEAVIEAPAGKVRVLAAHPVPPMSGAATRERDAYLAGAADLASRSDLPTILAGDLNATRWCTPYRRLLKTATLQDLADGQGLRPTWKPFGTALLGLPIDHLLASSEFSVSTYTVGPDLGSDHYPVTAVLKVAARANP